MTDDNRSDHEKALEKRLWFAEFRARAALEAVDMLCVALLRPCSVHKRGERRRGGCHVCRDVCSSCDGEGCERCLETGTWQGGQIAAVRKLLSGARKGGEGV